MVNNAFYICENQYLYINTVLFYTIPYRYCFARNIYMNKCINDMRYIISCFNFKMNVILNILVLLAVFHCGAIDSEKIEDGVILKEKWRGLDLKLLQNLINNWNERMKICKKQ